MNRLAGEAARRVETAEGLQMVADVFWFTIEFGVLHEDGELRAYGAGILSSYGEIEEFRGMEIRPLDFAQMATIEYDITNYQPVLFGAESFAPHGRRCRLVFRRAATTTPPRASESRRRPCPPPSA